MKEEEEATGQRRGQGKKGEEGEAGETNGRKGEGGEAVHPAVMQY